MDNDRWRQIEDIFQTVAERERGERDAYLTQVCGGDRELRREVESLLAHEVFDTFIQEPIKGAAKSLAAGSERDLIGQHLGPYRVAELIGHGGMGAVYAALRDDDQFNRRVAVKIVKRGMDSSFVLSRFRHERQILASLEHPNIARLLDGGSTADGRPYFVMEFIEGQTITEFCAANQLSIAERIKLFRQVCGAVQYAHQKLVVHRDLKPSNILVNRDGVPKLLDFGVAKLLDPAQSAADPARTATMMRMMTPDYASPEQVRGREITTATDIYSLGAVLYELLTGQRPHRFQSYTQTEIERVVCETEVERPSEAAGKSDGLPTKARKQLAGDPDNIILMAMRKEPERRYHSVEQFSDDLLRYLEERPVIARSDSVGYRAGKFIQRHKAGVAAAALVIASLLGGLIATNYQARRAERRFAQVRKLANTFLFDFHDEIKNLPGSTRAREMVAKTAQEYLDSLAQEAVGDPALQLELAQAYLKVGDVQGDPWAPNLGHSDSAQTSYRKGLDLARRLAAEDDGNRDVLRVLADSYFKFGALQSEAGEKIGAGESLRTGIRMAESVAQQSGDLNDQLRLQNFYVRLGDVQLDTGDATSALESYRHAHRLAERRAAQYPSHEAQTELAADYGHVGEAQAALGDLPSALDSYRQALKLLLAIEQEDAMNQRHLRVMRVAYTWIGHLSGNSLFINQGDKKAATQNYRKAVEISQRMTAADPKNARASHDLAIDYGNLGDSLIDSDPAKAAEYHRAALRIVDTLLEASPGSFMFLRRQAHYLRGLGLAMFYQGNHQTATKHLAQSLEILQKLSAQDPANLQIRSDLYVLLNAMADTLLDARNVAEAGNYYGQALTVAEATAASRPNDLSWQWRLADSYSAFGRYYATLASDPKSRLAERIANWRQARDKHQQALGVWNEWEARAVSSSFNLTRREQASRAAAHCEAMLELLSATAQR